MPDLSFLSIELRTAVTRASTAVEQGLGEKLRSVLVVGAAVPPSELRAGEPVDLLAVVTDLPVPALSNLAHQLNRTGEPTVRVRVLTERELLRSADVFTLQLADYQARHVVLVGVDPLTDLHFTRGELRRSIEQTLRALGWRLRDAVLQGAGRHGRKPLDVAPLVRESMAEVVVVGYHLLELVGSPRAATRDDVLGRLATTVGGSGPLLAALAARAEDEPAPDDAMSLLADLLQEVELITSFVDEVGAGE